MTFQIINHDEQISVVKEQNQNNLEHVSFIVLGFTFSITEFNCNQGSDGVRPSVP